MKKVILAAFSLVSMAQAASPLYTLEGQNLTFQASARATVKSGMDGLIMINSERDLAIQIDCRKGSFSYDWMSTVVTTRGGTVIGSGYVYLSMEQCKARIEGLIKDPQGTTFEYGVKSGDYYELKLSTK